MLTERRRFLRSFLTAPRQVGAVLPTSSRTAAKMLDMAEIERRRRVVELGAGSGPITRETLPRLAPDARFWAFELDRSLAAGLSRELSDPRLEVVAGSATGMEAHLGGERADAIISAIPFTSLPKPAGAEILDAVERCLADDGVFIVLQYSPMVEGELRRRFPTVERRISPVNVPPAVLYACRPGPSPA